ncbi:MAG: hypothetical protein AAB723_00200 [Patescibacteria group bacterium]
MEFAVILISAVMLVFIVYGISETVSERRLKAFAKRLGEGSFPITVGWGKGFCGFYLIISINTNDGEFFKTHQEIEIEMAKDGQGKAILVIENAEPKLILPTRMVEQIQKTRAKTSPADYSG